MACCCLLAAACIGMFTNAYGVFYTPLSEALSVGRGSVALHATISGLLTGLASPVVIKAMSRVKLWGIIGSGMILMSGSTFLTAAADNVWQLNILGVLKGLGCACCYIPVLTVILGNWFDRYYGTVMGVTFSFSGIAGALFSPMLSFIIEKQGYQRALLTAGSIVIVFCLPGLFFCRTKPSELGLEILRREGEDAKSSREQEGLKSQEDRKGKLEKLYQSTDFIVLCVVGFLAVFLSGFTQHLTGYSEAIGAGTGIGVMMMSCTMAGNIAFKLLSGVLIDLVGGARTAAGALALTVLALVVLLFHPSAEILLYAAAFLFGAIYSLGAVSLAAVSRSVFGKEQYGEAYSVISALSCVGASLSLTAIGCMYDLSGGYTVALVCMILFGLASILGLEIIGSRIQKKPSL